MADHERLHEAVIKDIEQKVREVIATPENEYLLGNLHGRLIAFALARVISKEELDRYHDQLEAAGLQSIRFKNIFSN